jgi:DNA-binding NarL/FixJ family response regulator
MSPTSPITIVLGRFDDLLARGLRELLQSDGSLELLAGGVEQGRLAVVLRAHAPAVAIIDFASLQMPAEVRELSASFPHTRLILLMGEQSQEECAQLLAFGAAACLGRETQSRDVLNAIHLASRGLQVAPRPVAGGRSGASYGSSHPLTQREAEVLPLLQQGRSNAQIALALGVGVETVRTHARNIYRKLGVSSRRELSPPVLVPVMPPAVPPARAGEIIVRRRGDAARPGPVARR